MSRQSTKTASPKAQRRGQGQTRTERLAQNQKAPTVSRSNAELLAAQEAKREARRQRQALAQDSTERHRRLKRLRSIGIAVAAALVVVGALIAYFISETNKPGQGVGQQLSPHIKDVNTQHAPYDSDPPTSGPHVPETAPWGVSTTPVPKEKMVHNLEDAGVVISYKPDLDKTTVDFLANLTRSYDTDVLMAPYPGLSNPIVLTAWGRIDRMDTFDEARIKRFISAFKGIDHHKDSGS